MFTVMGIDINFHDIVRSDWLAVHSMNQPHTTVASDMFPSVKPRWRDILALM